VFGLPVTGTTAVALFVSVGTASAGVVVSETVEVGLTLGVEITFVSTGLVAGTFVFETFPAQALSNISTSTMIDETILNFLISRSFLALNV
jgi:hypothetical protein